MKNLTMSKLLKQLFIKGEISKLAQDYIDKENIRKELKKNKGAK